MRCSEDILCQHVLKPTNSTTHTFTKAVTSWERCDKAFIDLVVPM